MWQISINISCRAWKKKSIYSLIVACNVPLMNIRLSLLTVFFILTNFFMSLLYHFLIDMLKSPIMVVDLSFTYHPVILFHIFEAKLLMHTHLELF